MKKIFVELLLSFLLISAYGQSNSKNQFSVNFNKSFLTQGDTWGFHLCNYYQRKLVNKLNIGIGLGLLYSADESSIMLNVEDYENNLITGDWMFTTEDGFKILKMKTNQQTCIHADIFLKYSIIRLNQFYFDILSGGSIAYISTSYLTRWELGTFNSMTSGEQNLQLYFPYYSRLIDLGINSRINLGYKVTNTFSFGISAGVNHYFQSGYRFFDFGLNLDISF